MAGRDDDFDGRGPYVPAQNFAPMTLEEEALAGGWTRGTMPVGGDPGKAMVAGTRGDPDLDSDQSYGAGATSKISDKS